MSDDVRARAYLGVKVKRCNAILLGWPQRVLALRIPLTAFRSVPLIQRIGTSSLCCSYVPTAAKTLVIVGRAHQCAGAAADR